LTQVNQPKIGASGALRQAVRMSARVVVSTASVFARLLPRRSLQVVSAIKEWPNPASMAGIRRETVLPHAPLITTVQHVPMAIFIPRIRRGWVIASYRETIERQQMRTCPQPNPALS
jgi:hypothetical protein